MEEKSMVFLNGNKMGHSICIRETLMRIVNLKVMESLDSLVEFTQETLKMVIKTEREHISSKMAIGTKVLTPTTSEKDMVYCLIH
jgi:hypothetical protein